MNPSESERCASISLQTRVCVYMPSRRDCVFKVLLAKQLFHHLLTGNE